MEVDANLEETIAQLTQRKLQYCRDLLAGAGLPHSGDRELIRKRLRDGLNVDRLHAVQLTGLLEEFDAWGDQRIRVTAFDTGSLDSFASADDVLAALETAGLTHCFGGTVPMTPPESLEPVAVRYVQDAARRALILVAAKTRVLWERRDDIADYTDEANYPGIVFRPFQREGQKVIAFAEIDIDSGMALFSSAILRRGATYTAEWDEFYYAFEPLLDLRVAADVVLYNATSALYALPQTEVRQCSQNRRTAIGGTVAHRSHRAKADMRADSDLLAASGAIANLPCEHFNGYWNRLGDLQEIVHTHVYAPRGEITILGQVREESARYVLQRALDLN